ncbi:hypothetical protein SLS60_000816 [Paraconiothyrium brasiliense]|uniref:Amidoligase enzyme n=1 Tax=Paraconiothyrium brasiliense TaxID=300254 RepID=A0ABR3S7B2_9PLEO
MVLENKLWCTEEDGIDDVVRLQPLNIIKSKFAYITVSRVIVMLYNEVLFSTAQWETELEEKTALTQMDPSITFGVEIEFICVYEENAFTNLAKYPGLIPDEEKGEFDHVEPGHAIWYMLNKANIAAAGWEDLDAPPVRPYSTWTVKEDEVQLSDGERRCIDGYEERPIELTSPVLKLADPQSFQQIQRVLRTLAYMEDEFSCRFVTNKTCGLHVHIGCGEDKFIPLPVAKRVFQLTTAHEHNFDAMHAASRVRAPIDCTGDDSYLLFAPLSFFHRNAEASSCNKNVFHWLQSIEAARTYADVCRFFQIEWGTNLLDGHRATINFDNLFFSEVSRKVGDDVTKTIEFRQHVGSLDFVEISRYVLFLGYTVSYCFQAADEQFIKLLVKATDARFTVEHLMHAVGAPADVLALRPKKQNARLRCGSGVTVVSGGPPTALAALMARNAHELAMNKDSDKTNEIRDEKWKSGLYGLDRAFSALVMDSDHVQDMIVEAASSVYGSQPDVELDEVSSQARATVFSKLANMYR